jgi:hypothetical protein
VGAIDITDSSLQLQLLTPFAGGAFAGLCDGELAGGGDFAVAAAGSETDFAPLDRGA